MSRYKWTALYHGYRPYEEHTMQKQLQVARRRYHHCLGRLLAAYFAHEARCAVAAVDAPRAPGTSLDDRWYEASQRLHGLMAKIVRACEAPGRVPEMETGYDVQDWYYRHLGSWMPEQRRALCEVLQLYIKTQSEILSVPASLFPGFYKELWIVVDDARLQRIITGILHECAHRFLKDVAPLVASSGLAPQVYMSPEHRTQWGTESKVFLDQFNTTIAESIDHVLDGHETILTPTDAVGRTANPGSSNVFGSPGGAGQGVAAAGPGTWNQAPPPFMALMDSAAPRSASAPSLAGGPGASVAAAAHQPYGLFPAPLPASTPSWGSGSSTSTSSLSSSSAPSSSSSASPSWSASSAPPATAASSAAAAAAATSPSSAPAAAHKSSPYPGPASAPASSSSAAAKGSAGSGRLSGIPADFKASDWACETTRTFDAATLARRDVTDVKLLSWDELLETPEERFRRKMREKYQEPDAAYAERKRREKEGRAPLPEQQALKEDCERKQQPYLETTAERSRRKEREYRTVKGTAGPSVTSAPSSSSSSSSGGTSGGSSSPSPSSAVAAASAYGSGAGASGNAMPSVSGWGGGGAAGVPPGASLPGGPAMPYGGSATYPGYPSVYPGPSGYSPAYAPPTAYAGAPVAGPMGPGGMVPGGPGGMAPGGPGAMVPGAPGGPGGAGALGPAGWGGYMGGAWTPSLPQGRGAQGPPGADAMYPGGAGSGGAFVPVPQSPAPSFVYGPGLPGLGQPVTPGHTGYGPMGGAGGGGGGGYISAPPAGTAMGGGASRAPGAAPGRTTPLNAQDARTQLEMMSGMPPRT